MENSRDIDDIHITFITVAVISVLFITMVANLLLCLIYKLNFTIVKMSPPQKRGILYSHVCLNNGDMF
jgi:hypothetical protein